MLEVEASARQKNVEHVLPRALLLRVGQLLIFGRKEQQIVAFLRLRVKRSGAKLGRKTQGIVPGHRAEAFRQAPGGACRNFPDQAAGAIVISTLPA